MTYGEAKLIGNVGESMAINYMMKMKNAKSVFDVRKDKLFQKYDVDFLLQMIDGSVRWIEVKTDTIAYKTGNLAYETSKRDGDLKGGLERSVATDLLYYVVSDDLIGRLYLVNIDGLRNYIKQFTPEEIDMGDRARGVLVPIKDLILYAIAEELKWQDS